MTAKTILASALAAAMGAASTAIAADLTVNQGETRSLANGEAYDAVVVNGNLTIPANATVTFASLVVANTACDATVTLAPGSSLTVNGEVHLGQDGGQAHLNVGSTATLLVKGASLYMATGYTSTPAANAEPTRAFLTITNATVELEGNPSIVFSHNGSWPSGTTTTATSVDTVRLEEGAVLKYYGGMSKSGGNGRSSTVVFAGGMINGRNLWNSYIVNHQCKNTSLNLVSENGNPVYFKATGKVNRWFQTGGTTEAWIKISGDGDLVLENAAGSSYADVDWYSGGKWEASSPKVTFQTGGKIRLIGGNLVSYPVNAFSTVNGNTLRTLVLESGATFDMKGVDAEFAEVYSPVLNSTGSACTLTVGGDGSNVAYPCSLSSGVTLAKKGAGSLSLFAADAAAVAVQGGSLSLKGRAEIGYPFYKFNHYATTATGAQNHRVRISEFKFLNGSDDVTQGWDAYYYDHTGTSIYTEPTLMWDQNTGTDFYDARDQYWGDVSNVLAVLEYRPARKVSGYTWHVSGSDEYNTRRNSFPSSWAVFGSLDNATWTRLDLVENFTPASIDAGAWCGTNFVCAYAPTAATLASLTLASGATLAVDGADVTVSSATTAAGVPLTLAHGAVLALPAATEVASLSVDVDAGGGTLTNFRPASGGAVYLAGDIAKPRSCVLPVSVGSLLGGNLSTWDVFANGSKVDSAEVFVNADGFLETRSNAATVVIMR